MAGKLVFSTLDDSERFHRDSRIGRIFHRGTMSFREESSYDSLHIAVAPGNRVSVHVDRVSPLTVRSDRRCRYSPVRVVRHNVVHFAEVLTRLMRGNGERHNCHLDCAVVTLQDVGEERFEFSCEAAGAQGCHWKTRATTEEELVAKVSDHARAVHGVSAFGDTLARYALNVARQTDP